MRNTEEASEDAIGKRLLGRPRGREENETSWNVKT
jgi:hypothetical protein